MSDRDSSRPKADILVVDDRPNNLRLLSTMLLEQGYQVRKAIDAEMALTAIETAYPDLILLDILMPNMNGYELCQVLKERRDTRDIPIIFLSALEEPLDKVTAFEVGGADYISKPFQLEEVLARINYQLTIQRQRQELADNNQRLQEEIYERQQAQEILHQSRALLSSILNCSLDGVAAMEAVRNVQGKIRDFRCLVVNPVAVQVVGREWEELVGQVVLKKLLRVIDRKLFDVFVNLVETGKAVKQEVCLQRQNETIWYQFVAVKLGDGFAMTFRDVTEYKQMVLSLSQANQELQRLSTMDGLTQVANRRYFDMCIAQAWQDSQEKQKPLGLILLDVDYFKRYNDTYGHQLGDRCLQIVARTIEQRLKRPGEIVARYGGEEFAILLPNGDTYWALQIAELIRADIQALEIQHEPSEIDEHLTISLGIANAIPSAEETMEMMITRADRALYEAKRQGRNRSVVYDQNFENPEY
ncbi:MAG: diguanylate cyclase [Jaaginema sp. PMC 1079.18]|nr:diguanylate cyclase [Jaaginema sp. PMC 1080.18]MEC4849778.1 diguanylate cyclase [Jaaginema sp. PMC 1079.18]MEC4865703.1 diguanylate cyclase [Jaaginema sp. PMC 1078.18]